MDNQQFDRIYDKIERIADDVSGVRENVAKLEAHMQHMPTNEAIEKAIKEHVSQCTVRKPLGSKSPFLDPGFLFKALMVLAAAIAAVLGGIKIL